MRRPRVAVLEAIHSDGVAALEAFANVEPHVGMEPADLLRLARDWDAIVVKSVTRVDAALLEAAPSLRVVGRAGTGTENIDMELAAQRGVQVLTVPTGNSVSAAEFTVAQILNLCHRIQEVQAAVHKQDYRRHLYEGRELSALTVGLVGLGNVGIAVATRLAPFECRLLAWDPNSAHTEAFASIGGELAGTFDELLPQVDVLSFHVTLTPATRGMLGPLQIARVKPGLLIVNTARGAVLDDAALLAGLDTGKVAAAALDVLYPEPPFDAEPGSVAYAHPLLSHPRVFITPHVGASTVDAQRRIALDLAHQMREVMVKAASRAPRAVRTRG